MAERGSNAHGPELDDQMKHETDGLTKGNQPAHLEEFRQTEPLPDDTDSDEVREAFDGNDVVEGGENEE